ncbi:MAG TPA: hypothetical protein VFY39_00025 [Gammaproteobacteria bacterium]|nr:hypothetical protein [Gammaproteobacteria bacterium]
MSGAAIAQQSQLPPFDQVDKNADGNISRSEAAQIEGLDFNTVDTNQDGKLSRTEYMTYAGTQGSGGAQAQPGQPDQQQPGQAPGEQPGQPEQGQQQ